MELDKDLENEDLFTRFSWQLCPEQDEVDHGECYLNFHEEDHEEDFLGSFVIEQLVSRTNLCTQSKLKEM